MAGRGRGRPRKVTTSKAVGAQDSLIDSVPAATGVPAVATTPSSPENTEIAEQRCGEPKAVNSIEHINIEETRSSSTELPETTDVASAFVPNRGRKGTQNGKRKPLQVLHQNGAISAVSSPPAVKASDTCGDQDREIAMRQICDAIDEEVANRSNLIRAIASTQLASISSQLKLQLSRLPVHVQNMPLLEFLKSYPNIESKEMDDGWIQLKKASPCAVLLRDSKKNLSEILNKARDNPTEEPGSQFKTPGFGPMKTTASQFHLFTSEDLSWPEYHAKLQALGHIGSFGVSSETHHQPDSAVSLKTGLLRGMTPKTVRIPKEGEVLLSVNGSPLGQFGLTPGPYGDKFASGMKLRGARVTRSTKKRSSRGL
ncbi:hypothetical protein Mapa_014779 [Marchantia paleacea]|nr:hypothetical protein Mapa_014779 [Marchantia paleacea]